METMTMKEVQAATKELLVQVDALCMDLGIQYFLIFGSLLGAIRHKGFIPWDDDLDIGMMAADYYKLEKYFKNNTGDLELHNQETNPNCFYNIARITEKKHRFIFPDQQYESGAFIDIYVFEGLGSDEDLKSWEKRFKHYDKWRKGIYMSVNPTIMYGSNKLHKILNIPFVLFAKKRGKQFFIDKFNDYKPVDIDESKYIGIPRWEPTVYEREWFDDLIRVPFEDISVLIPSEYDKILSQEYGEYMQFPPEEKRRPYHGFIAYK